MERRAALVMDSGGEPGHGPRGLGAEHESDVPRCDLIPQTGDRHASDLRVVEQDPRIRDASAPPSPSEATSRNSDQPLPRLSGASTQPVNNEEGVSKSVRSMVSSGGSSPYI